MTQTMATQNFAWRRAVWQSLALATALLCLPALAQTPAPAASAAQATPAAKPAKKAFKDPDSCFECHDDLLEEKVIHKAIKDGCLDCHVNLEAATRPHKNTGDFKYGLDAEQPALCFGCHKKDKFKNVSTHKAIDKGCTACHDPHSSKNKKLLKKAVPVLCQSCHKKEGFTGKGAHDPVQNGDCLDCHAAHASANMALLAEPPRVLCLDCHADVKKKPHMLSGFSRNSHPLGDEREQANPANPNKPFYCGSCHDPHKSDNRKLLRLDPQVSMEACQSCHHK